MSFITKSVRPFSVNNTVDENLIQFCVHSTFRNNKTGEQIFPRGLEWGVPGTSYLTYYRRPGREIFFSNGTTLEYCFKSTTTRRALVEAYNIWAFAKQLPFKREQDIVSVKLLGDSHVDVEWKQEDSRLECLIVNRNIKELLEEEDAASEENDVSAEVWINGVFVSVLNGTSSLKYIMEALGKTRSHHLCYKRSEGLIRIERKFKGCLMNRDVVFEHVLDNLFAMEDVEILDDQYNQLPTMIGTATLPDWIMGGKLTSRIWIQELNDGTICFERPLYDDHISTSDRTFELRRGADDDLIRIVKRELERLRQIASVDHPLLDQIKADAMNENGRLEKEDPALEKRRLQHRLNSRHRKFMGL